MSNIFISVVIPAYNEAGRIERTLASVRAYFSDRPLSHEIIVVDDGSTDNTADIVRNAIRNTPELRLIENGSNRGKGFAVRSGMQNARGRYRLFMDADNSVDILHLDKFLPWMDQGYDIAIGSIQIAHSRVTEHAGWHRRILGRAAKILIGIVASPGIEDTQRGFKLFSAAAAEVVFALQTIERWGFDIEILTIAWLYGFHIKELPVAWDNPTGSKVTLRSYIQTLRELLHIMWNRSTGKYTSRFKEDAIVSAAEFPDAPKMFHP